MPKRRTVDYRKTRADLFPVAPAPYVLGSQTFGDLRLVVGSVPRSGTTWLANVFANLGLPAGHERLFGPNALGLQRANGVVVDVSGFIQSFLPALRDEGIPVVHLVRHPVDTLNSILSYFPSQFPPGKKNESWKYLCDYYLDSHSRLDDYAAATIYLERLTAGCVKNLLRMVGKPRPAGEIEQAMRGSYRGRSTPGKHFSWGHLPEELKEYARRHQYSG